MTHFEKLQLYSELEEFYGPDHQCMICIEEMSELTKEIIKNHRGNLNIYKIAEEVADVEIMIEQIKKIYGIQELVDCRKDEKLVRTKARLLSDKIKSE